MNKTARYAIYTLIIVICIVAIGIGVYGQFFMKDKAEGEDGSLKNENGNLITGQDVKQSFLDLFTNEFYSNYDGTGVEKKEENKDFIYTAFGIEETVEGKYSVNVKIPIVNINTEIANKYNETTQKIFVDKINSVLTNVDEYTIYNLDYIAYTNENILSLAIMGTIKEGDSPQRIIVQTYNYDLETGKDVTVKEILNRREIDETVVQKKISQTIKKASEDAAKMAESGYSVYQRDISNEMYKIENVKSFIQGPNGELYIVFPYGNNNFTSEMDVVEI